MISILRTIFTSSPKKPNKRCNERRFEPSLSVYVMHKRMKSSLLTIMIVCFSLALTGCATTYVRWYDGPPRNRDEIAVLKAQYEMWGESAFVKSIDGTPLGKGKLRNANPHEIEFSPGEHTVEASYFTGLVQGISPIKLTFNGHTGRVCELRVAKVDEGFSGTVRLALGGGGHYTAWIIDSETQEVVAGKPRPEPYRWYEK